VKKSNFRKFVFSKLEKITKKHFIHGAYMKIKKPAFINTMSNYERLVKQSN